jgi:homoserine kinase
MIEVYAPASIGNFAVGFDALGAALAPIDVSLFALANTRISYQVMPVKT